VLRKVNSTPVAAIHSMPRTVGLSAGLANAALGLEFGIYAIGFMVLVRSGRMRAAVSRRGRQPGDRRAGTYDIEGTCSVAIRL